MATTIPLSGVQYSGKWTLQSQAQAVAAGTWSITPTIYLWSWGQNATGQLGLANITKYSSPKQVGSIGIWSISNANFSAGNTSITVKKDGTLWAWGANSFGQIGLGNTTSYSSPKQVGSLANWSKVIIGARFSLAVKTDGTLWSWGRGTSAGA